MGIGSSRHQADGSRGRGDSLLLRKSSSATSWSKFDSRAARKFRPSFANQIREICGSPNKGGSIQRTNLRNQADGCSGRVDSSLLKNSGNQYDFHVQKKRKVVSISQIGELGVSKTKGVSRLSEYPQAKPQLKREVHAPSRVRRFGSASSSNRAPKIQQSGAVGIVDDMGNAVRKQYEAAKGGLLQALKFMKEPETKEDYSDYSSVEVVVNVEDDHEGRSVISDHKLQEGIGLTVIPKKIEDKIVEDGIIPGSSSEVSNMTKVEDAEKKLNSLSLTAEHYVDDVPLHKKLLESANRYNPKLYRLESDIKLEQTRLESYRSLRPVKKPEEEVEPVDDSAHLREPFVPLSEEDEVTIASAFSNSNRWKVLVAHESSNIEITGEVLRCLRPGAWLNDEVINVYLELLKERERREPQKYLKCHFFNTFFYKKLIGGKTGYDYKSVRRWTTQRKLGYGLIECDKIFVPIHQSMHWCLAVIDKKGQKFQYLDSLGGKDPQVLKMLARYYVEEVKDKSGQEIDVASWPREFVKDNPKQKNGCWNRDEMKENDIEMVQFSLNLCRFLGPSRFLSDCGVFMIKYSDFYSRGMGLDFSQEHMPYFRLRTAKEILQLRAD